MKQMFNISEKLLSEQSDEISGLETIVRENSPWKVMNKSPVFRSQRSTSFSDYDCVLLRFSRTHQSRAAWEQRLEWFKTSQEYRDFDRIDGEPMEFEGIFSHDSPHCRSATKSKEILLRDHMRHQRISQEG